MTVECFIQNMPQHAHETEAILALAQMMRRAFGASEHYYLLAVNVRFWRAQADALALAPRAIVLLEFKACDAPIYGREHGSWRVLSSGDKLGIKGGSYDNPYQQIAATREALIKYLDRNRRRFLSDDRAREMDRRWGHVSAALVFSPCLHSDSDVVVPPQSRAWLGVVGLNEAAEYVFSRLSPQLDLRPQELRRLASQALGCRPWTEIETLLPPVPNHGYLWLLDEEGRRAYAIPIVDETTLGRSHDNTVVVPRRFSHASRRHARLRLAGQTVWLYDEGSTHGTFVNGKPVVAGCGLPLQDGDYITLGGVAQPGACRLRYTRGASPDTESTWQDK